MRKKHLGGTKMLKKLFVQRKMHIRLVAKQACIGLAIPVFEGARSSKLSSKTVQGKKLGKVWSLAGIKL